MLRLFEPNLLVDKRNSGVVKYTKNVNCFVGTVLF